MRRRPPRSTRTDTLFPYTTLFRSHHRHGDLWANAAALVLLASQWFNPFAWRAIRAFRFDQEAACDARVLNMVDREGADREGRSEERRVGKACVSTGRSRW